MENYTDLMELCLEKNNPQAHYIERMKEYFHNNNKTKGLDHLRPSADGVCDNGWPTNDL
ncbi:hypothetical protein Bca4012_073963 [Brassica carinata]|uniref:Uncharacterized protein n=2 Tax=Brassica TaxID=3705 RepID=A0A8S9S635_BRACR|nr:hypothetical protein F2Q69_00031381 [Brassica cretica]CAF1933716.1 unnamed protein product [Brassica napus]